MGCDIHAHAERKTDNGYEVIEGLRPFNWRSYGMYGFLADVRNYSAVKPLVSEPRGTPEDSPYYQEPSPNDWEMGEHSHSWLSLSELLSVNYDQIVEDRRCTRQVGPNQWDGGQTCAPGEGKKMSLRDFLGEGYFDDLAKLKEAGADRVVFYFDS